MATNKVNLGIGRATTGMFYTAPAGTALPTDSSSALTSWVESGAITEDGIVWAGFKDSEPLRNWGRQIERLIASDEGGTVTAPLMYTDQKTLETIFGAGNVSVAAASSTHGKVVSVTVEAGVSAEPMAFLFVMKDGDDLIFLGTTRGIVREVGDVTMSPTEAIVWEATIEADSWTLIKDDGQVTS